MWKSGCCLAGVDYLARTPQNLSNTVWAYGVVVSKPRHLMMALQHHLTAASGFYDPWCMDRSLKR